ncbi:MAG TPA: lamin tail domain-containing protein [Lacipirellulaceae bacterium]|nr:lamin tail domain-containing protein [Lacipirellulaceae bacterium]
MSSRIRFILLASIVVAASCVTGRADVIVSEIMYNPQGTDLDTTVTPHISREWVELYNTGSTAMNIGGWQFGDAQDNDWATAFPAGTMIGANQTLVVTGDATSFDKEWGSGINRIQVGNFPILANTPSPTNETAAIRNAAGVIEDAVNFDQNFNQPSGWPKINGDDGQSIFLLPQGLSSTGNDIGSNWKPSMLSVYGAKFKNADGENHGSPGYVGTVAQTPFTPSPDAAWSMVIMPDTQNYVKWADYQSILTGTTTWIRDNRDAYKIQAVLQEGDIVNNDNTNNPTSGDQVSTQQWQAARTSFSVLNGYVPYIMAAGNHDFGTTNAQNRDTMINNYFHPSDNPLTDPAQGGILKGEMNDGDISNAYYAFTAPDGRKMLIFSLEWEPRPAVVTWANQIAALPQYADYTASLLTHNYLESNGARSTTTNVAGDASGETLWQNLIKPNSNFEMVFNGHFGGDGVANLASTDNAGKKVEQMFLNTQFETMGGDGWIRLVEFLNDGKTVRIRTYSPYLDLYRTGSDYDFTFQLTTLPNVPGDYNDDGEVDTADYILWRKSDGSTTQLAADGNGDGLVSNRDYYYWRQYFGDSRTAAAGTSLAAVPEPTCAFLSLMLGCICFSLHLRRRAPCSISFWSRG